MEQRLTTSTLTRFRPQQGEEQEFFLKGKSDELDSPTQFQDGSTRDDEEAINDFWTITGDCIYRHYVVLRVKLDMPREETFPIPTKYIDATRTTYTSLDVLLEKHIEDDWNVGGEKEFIRCMDSLHKIHLIEWKGTWWVHIVRVETYEETNNLSSKQCMARYVEAYVWCSKEESKTKMDYRETKVRHARQLREIFFIELNNEEFMLTMKVARRKLEVPIPAAMICKIPIKSCVKTCRNVGKRKTKYACVVDADESTRPRLEGAGDKPHQDHVTANGTNSVAHYSLVHKFIAFSPEF